MVRIGVDVNSGCELPESLANLSPLTRPNYIHSQGYERAGMHDMVTVLWRSSETQGVCHGRSLTRPRWCENGAGDITGMAAH